MRTARRSIRSGERGAILTTAFFSAFLASIACYLVLQIAMIQARHAQFHEGHVGARHAAEAGVVWAYERLVNDAAYCGGGNPPAINGLAVDVDVTCGAPNTVTAQVTY